MASLDAIEYLPATPTASSIRTYRFSDAEDGAQGHRWLVVTTPRASGPSLVLGVVRCPLSRIVSRFNPHRMHPVLHVVMPHNGIDLAAPGRYASLRTSRGNGIGDGRERTLWKQARD